MLSARHRDEARKLQRSATAAASTLDRQAWSTEPVVRADPPIAPSMARRLLDVMVAAVILVLVWPVFLGLAVATRLSTGGTAIYRQRRVGQGGVPFTLYKFRTMRAWMAGPEVTAPGDCRITRLGALLRRTSLDELPQLLNVLLGQMTLVGPRPESVALAVRYPAEFQFVFQYRPGITGPSQVLVRDEKVLVEVEDVENFYLTKLVPHRVEMDLGYLRNPTLARTVRWLADTFRYLLHTARPKPGAARPELPAPAPQGAPPATESAGRA